eukprot:5435699-Pleurochrysis_carterae.AAC.4
MPSLVWLSLRWRFASDDLPLWAAASVMTRILFVVTIFIVSVFEFTSLTADDCPGPHSCKWMSKLWVACVCLINACGFILAIAVIRYGSRGAILDVEKRDSAVRPLLSSYLFLVFLEALSALWGIAELDSSSLRALAIVFACTTIVGLLILSLLWVQEVAHTETGAWVISTLRRLCCCTKGVTEDTLELIERAITQVVPNLDLTMSDAAAALVLVAAEQAQHASVAPLQVQPAGVRRRRRVQTRTHTRGIRVRSYTPSFYAP